MSAASPLQRFYALGSGAQGGCEVLLGAAGTPPSSYLQTGNRAFGVEGGLGLTLWGTPAPFDAWVGGFDTAPTTAIPAGSSAPPASLQLFPNDFAAPPSAIPAELPPRVNMTDVASILIAAHGSAVAALHSYDFSPEVRAAPCLAHDNTQCYAPMCVCKAVPTRKRAPWVIPRAHGDLCIICARSSHPACPSHATTDTDSLLQVQFLVRNGIAAPPPPPRPSTHSRTSPARALQ